MNTRDEEFLLDLLLAAASRESEAGDPLDDAMATPSMRERFLDAVGAEAHAPFSPRLAALFDVTLERAREILATVRDVDAWIEMVPGMRYKDFEGGPQAAAASVGLVRIQAGGGFPGHVHKGLEQTLVLQGTMLTGGKSYGPGDELEMQEGSWHELQAGEGDDLLYATVVDAIDIGPKPD